MTENKNHEIHEDDSQVETHEDHDHDSLNLKGTFLMVMALGGTIVVGWVLAFILFMSRM